MAENARVDSENIPLLDTRKAAEQWFRDRNLRVPVCSEPNLVEFGKQIDEARYRHFVEESQRRMAEERREQLEQNVWILDELEERESTRADPHVYAIRNTITGEIKIGWSRSPEARLRMLQDANVTLLRSWSPFLGVLTSKRAFTNVLRCTVCAGNGSLLAQRFWSGSLQRTTPIGEP